MLTIVLFFVISPVYAQLSLSDATGLIDRLDVQTSGHVFEIKLVSNFDLTDYHFEKDRKQLVLNFESGCCSLTAVSTPARGVMEEFPEQRLR